MCQNYSVMISYYSEETPFVLKHKRLVSKWLKGMATINNHSVGTLNYIFCSDRYLLDINRKFLGHDYLTDIITFDNASDYTGIYPEGTLSGDIYISIDTVRYNADAYGEGFERELHRVIAHGLLHLIGFDDTSKELQKEMRAQEDKALNLWFEILANSIDKK